MNESQFRFLQISGLLACAAIGAVAAAVGAEEGKRKERAIIGTFVGAIGFFVLVQDLMFGGGD